jgi:outer membrane lipoprotein SlyB
VKRPRLACFLILLLAIATILLACGDTRSLQSVSVSPATASSQAQFTATGIYNKMPTNVDITATTTWCVGSTSGGCVGNIIAGATVTTGMAQCLSGFTGTVTVLAGQAGPMGKPDGGNQLKPFGAAQLTCP